jgi:sulfur relay (sulfurtransferase) complex TusBCD TusD component (DsrE family)
MLALVDGCDGVAASAELHVPASLHFASSKEMLRYAKTHVASVHFNCFKCFREMLQLFHTDVAKVD